MINDNENDAENKKHRSQSYKKEWPRPKHGQK